MLARPDHADWHRDVWILNAILALWMSASGRLQRFSHICVLKEILKLGRTLSVVRTDAGWSSSKLLDIEEGPDGNPRHSDE